MNAVARSRFIGKAQAIWGLSTEAPGIGPSGRTAASQFGTESEITPLTCPAMDSKVETTLMQQSASAMTKTKRKSASASRDCQSFGRDPRANNDSEALAHIDHRPDRERKLEVDSRRCLQSDSNVHLRQLSALMAAFNR